METAMRESTLDAIRQDQHQLRDSLSECIAVADSIVTHLQGDHNLKAMAAEAPQEARPSPPGMLGQMCEQGQDNQASLNRVMSTLQSISHLTGAS